MVLRYFSIFADDRLPDTEHLKDSRFKMIVVGYALPSCILVVVAANLTLGKVYIPADRWVEGNIFDGLINTYGYGWQFAGIVTGKVGLAAAHFSWYALANHERTERWAQVALLVSIIIAALGVVLYGVGFFL